MCPICHRTQVTQDAPSYFWLIIRVRSPKCTIQFELVEGKVYIGHVSIHLFI